MIHHGSYATTLLLVCCGAAGLAQLGRMGLSLLLVHLVLFGACWLTPRTQHGTTPLADWNVAALCAMVLAGLTFAAVALAVDSAPPTL